MPEKQVYPANSLNNCPMLTEFLKKRGSTMKRFLRTFTSLLLSGAFTVMMAMPASADAYTFKNYERTDFISKDQFDKILQTLRNHSSEDASGASTNAYFTGVTYSSYEEAEKIINAFSDLYMGDDMYGIVKVPEGNWTVTLTNASVTCFDKDFVFNTTNNSATYNPAGIYIGWLPGADPKESLRQHDEASAALRNILSSAPQDDYGFYKYMYEWLCRNVSYDYTYQRISKTPYSTLINGQATCMGYSTSFMCACYETGRPCTRVSMIIDGVQHSRNLVYYDSVPKWIDATFGDQVSHIDYDYFMRDLDSYWINYFNEPFFSYE